MGDLSYHYKLHKKDLSDATKIEEIKQSIVNLKLSVNSYVIIDLPPKKSFPYLVFFQTARKRSFKHTNYYVYEIRIDISTPHGIQKKNVPSRSSAKKRGFTSVRKNLHTTNRTRSFRNGRHNRKNFWRKEKRQTI